jgi:hypothetical protein
VSSRREARARVSYAENAAEPGNAIPAPLRLGPCMEVWADPGVTFAQYSCTRRFKDARHHWGERLSLGRLELQEAIPHEAPWSADYLIEDGRAGYVNERFARAGCTVNDIPALQADADALIKPTSIRKAVI